MTRGTRAVSQLLNVLLFQVRFFSLSAAGVVAFCVEAKVQGRFGVGVFAQVFPTSLEFLLVVAVLYLKVGMPVALMAVGTLVAYAAFTGVVTDRRAKLRREANRLETQSAGQKSL